MAHWRSHSFYFGVAGRDGFVLFLWYSKLCLELSKICVFPALAACPSYLLWQFSSAGLILPFGGFPRETVTMSRAYVVSFAKIAAKSFL